MLCVSGGFNPDIHLFTQSKGLLKWDENLITFKPDKIFQNTITLGSVSGNFSYQNIMKEINENPLQLEDKLYTIEEFGYAVRSKFGGDENISNVMLGEIILAKYPVYSCKIKKPKNHISQKSCGCC